MNTRATCLASCLVLLLIALAAPASAAASFGLNSLSATAKNEDESIDLEAGTHPFEYTLSFNMNLGAEEKPEGTLREVVVDLPPGLIGNPLATPRCTGAQFEGLLSHCPDNTQIGILHSSVRNLESTNVTAPIYNLTPSPGVPFSAGFSLGGFNLVQEASIRSGTDYGATVAVAVPPELEIRSASATIWGVPASASHDPDRWCFPAGGTVKEGGCSLEEAEVAEVPFFTLPTSCGAPLETTVTVTSLQEPNNPQHETVESIGEGGPEGIKDCERPAFEPEIVAHPETSAADSPTGLHFGLHLEQNQSPDGTATAQVKDTVLTLPNGLSVNASAADGRGACSPAQVGLETAPGVTPIEFSPDPAECPANSQVGTVQVKTPLVDHPLPGTVYLAKQSDNPFNSMIALYIAVHDPITGVVAKLPVKVEPDQVTGQLRTVLTESPQLPFEDLSVDITGGPRASLTTPSTCGEYTVSSDFTPWTSPAGPDAFPISSFLINSSPLGGPCAQTESQLPNTPSFEAGTVSPLAGSFSPFVTRVNRENGTQHLQSLNVTLPPGVSAKLAGVKECSDAQIAQAQGRNQLGQGALEQRSPSCPQASEIGTVTAGAGSGTPFFVQGHAYLAGPYKGAPLSAVFIVPAVAGPFDLGNVVSRAALYVNETTAQATVKSDPLPTILHGIPLDVRSIIVKANRPNFTLNPTSCEEKTVSGEAISLTGALAPLSNRFQVGGCKGLDFSPKLSLQMKGGTRRSSHPALKAVLTQPSGQANIARTTVILPPTTFIDQNHISNPCTRAQFAEHKCPPASVLGKARVFTPLLDKPLEGPVYFRSNGGERELPDVVADLNGQVHFVLVGFTDSVHKKGSESSRVRTIFATVPDAPVSKAVIELNGGKKGLLVNSANLCKVPNKANVKMRAQNGKTQDSSLKIGTSCGK